MSGIRESTITLIPVLLLMALITGLFAVPRPAGTATNIFTDNFSNIPLGNAPRKTY